MKHGASYISDPKGSLRITLKNSDYAIAYKQGSGIADFWVCGKCGVLVAVTYRQNSQLLGALNSRTLANWGALKQAQVASPKMLSDEDKIDRWAKVWFQSVAIEAEQ